jgi:hypothetical protein
MAWEPEPSSRQLSVILWLHSQLLVEKAETKKLACQELAGLSK